MPKVMSPMPISPPFLPARWFVEVVIEEPSGIRARYSIGPLASWSKMRDVVRAWEKEYGEGTTDVSCRRGDDARLADGTSPR